MWRPAPWTMLVDQFLATVAAEKSESFHQMDRDRIFKVIQDSGVGFAKLNSMVFDCYRQWVIDVALEALQDCDTNQEENSDKRRELVQTIGRLYHKQGKYSLAEQYLQEHPSHLCLEYSSFHQ